MKNSIDIIGEKPHEVTPDLIRSPFYTKLDSGSLNLRYSEQRTGMIDSVLRQAQEPSSGTLSPSKGSEYKDPSQAQDDSTQFIADISQIYLC